MKHYRILEIKGNEKKYIIQYLQKFFFGLYSWKNLNSESYRKYEDALLKVKSIIQQSDYQTSLYGFHYVDAYKLFKQRQKDKYRLNIN